MGSNKSLVVCLCLIGAAILYISGGDRDRSDGDSKRNKGRNWNTRSSSGRRTSNSHRKWSEGRSGNRSGDRPQDRPQDRRRGKSEYSSSDSGSDEDDERDDLKTTRSRGARSDEQRSDERRSDERRSDERRSNERSSDGRSSDRRSKVDQTRASDENEADSVSRVMQNSRIFEIAHSGCNIEKEPCEDDAKRNNPFIRETFSTDPPGFIPIRAPEESKSINPPPEYIPIRAPEESKSEQTKPKDTIPTPSPESYQVYESVLLGGGSGARSLPTVTNKRSSYVPVSLLSDAVKNSGTPQSVEPCVITVTPYTPYIPLLVAPDPLAANPEKINRTYDCGFTFLGQ